MARPKKVLVNGEQDKATIANRLIELVDVVRKSKNKSKSDNAFSDLVVLLDAQIKRISFKFNIAGYNFDDIYSEALFALRYKAIKDYDQTRGNGSGPYPFDKFATLCIRRHLSTKLKSSYQNKIRILNTSLSLDQDRNNSSSQSSMFDDSLSLNDILPITKGTIMEELEDKEYYTTLFKELYDKLSSFEREVFLLYAQKYSYEEMTDIINKNHPKEKVNLKSVDNALSRIKQKGKRVFKNFG